MDYSPQKSMYYNYPVKNLIKNHHLISDTVEYLQIILCVYRVNTSGKYPFIQYLLTNNGLNLLTLPALPVFSKFNKETLENYSKVFLSGILQIDNFEEFNKKLEFDGFYEYNGNLYLFFDTTKCEFNIDDIYLSTPFRFGLTDEIMNKCNVCNIPINKETTNFFINNNAINYLYDENDRPYEIPLAGFVGKPTPEKVNFVYTFGESAKNKSAILGPYFYFTNFNYAIRQCGWSYNYKKEYIHDKLVTDNEGKYLKGGIIRFALFTGKTNYIENMPNSPIDESEIKKQRLNDPSLNKNYEIQTLRISDHDGIWARTYDSAYLGNLELDDGSFIEEGPMIVLKDYNQQIPLSYHFIDKSTLGDNYDSNNHSYKIV
jgi:hypothetical protein